jgi:hypothetical protein
MYCAHARNRVICVNVYFNVYSSRPFSSSHATSRKVTTMTLYRIYKVSCIHVSTNNATATHKKKYSILLDHICKTVTNKNLGFFVPGYFAWCFFVNLFFSSGESLNEQRQTSDVIAFPKFDEYKGASQRM